MRALVGGGDVRQRSTINKLSVRMCIATNMGISLLLKYLRAIVGNAGPSQDGGHCITRSRIQICICNTIIQLSGIDTPCGASAKMADRRWVAKWKIIP